MKAEDNNPELRQTTLGRLERQTAFGWLIALAIFFGGAGGGIFLIGYFTNLFFYSPLSKIGLVLGPFLAIACAVSLFTDLGNKMKVPRLFTDLSRLSTSWISRGAWALSFFIVFGLAYSLTFFPAFSPLPWTGIAGSLGVVTALLAVVVLLYTGFLLGVVNSIPFWNNPLLPVLFITSGLSCGVAILLLIEPFVIVSHVPIGETLRKTEVLLILAQLIMLWAYLGVATHRDIASAESVRLIKMPIVLIIILGLLLPLCILLSSLLSRNPAVFIAFDAVAAIIELVGAFFLRFAIVKVGVHIRLAMQ